MSSFSIIFLSISVKDYKIFDTLFPQKLIAILGSSLDIT